MSSEPEKRRRPRRLRRVALRLLLLLALLTLLVPVALTVGLRSPALRAVWLDQASAAIERTSGIHVGASDFSFNPWNGEFSLESLSVAATARDRPFLVVPHLQGRLSPRSVLSGRILLRSVVVDGPAVDLSSPLPAAPASNQGESATSGIRLDVLDARLLDGAIRGPAVPEHLEVWLDRWRLDGVELRGALLDGQITLTLSRARLRVESRRRPSIEARLEARLSGAIGEEWVLESAEAHAAGLDLDLEGQGGFDPQQPLKVEFVVAGDAAVLFPDLTDGGRLDAEGELRWDARQGTAQGRLRIDGRGIPGALAEPWLSTAGFDRRRLGETAATVLADLVVGLDRPDPGQDRIVPRIEGTAELRWARGDRPLVLATLSAARREAGGARLALDAAWLPGDPGKRRLQLECAIPTWLDPAAIELLPSRLDFELPDPIGSAIAIGLDASRFPRDRPEVSMQIEATVRGSWSRPEFDLRAHWDDGPQRYADLSARSILRDDEIGVDFDALVLPGDPGSRRINGEWWATDLSDPAEGRFQDVRVDLDLPDVAAANRRWRGLVADLTPEGSAPHDWARGELPPILSGLLTGALHSRIVVDGPQARPEIEIDANWQPSFDESVELHGSAVPSAEATYFLERADGRLSIGGFELARLGAPETVRGRLDAVLELGTGPTGVEGALRVAGSELRIAGLELSGVRLEAVADGSRVELPVLAATLALPDGGPGPVVMTGRGGLVLGPPHRDVWLVLELEQPLGEIERLRAELRLDAGTLVLESLQARIAGHEAQVEARVPLALVEQLRGPLADLGLPVEDGPLSLVASNLQLGALLALFFPELPPVEATLGADLRLESLTHVGVSGRLSLSGMAVSLNDEPQLKAGGTMEFAVDHRSVELLPTVLEVSGGALRSSVPLSLAARVDLNAGWLPGDPFVDVVEGIRVEADGSLDAGALRPFLAGGTASGKVEVALRAEGTLADLSADLRLRGPEAVLSFRSPYPTRIEAPEVEARIRDGKLELHNGKARLNGGPMKFSADFDPEQGLRVVAAFDQVRYRLNFGLTVQTRGELELLWRATGNHLLSGALTIERGVLHRDIGLERAALQALFEPRLAADDRLARTIALDVRLDTDEGVFIKNNLADLHATWGEIDLGGTLARPTVDGQIDIDSGGWLFLLGETYRIDDGSLYWDATAVDAPRLEMETTSSSEDPTLRQQSRDWWAAGVGTRGPGQGGSLDFWGREANQAKDWATVSADMMRYTGDKLAGAMGAGLGRTEFSYEPLPLLGETDTQARFTIAQQLSRNVTFIASNNPREAEGQTYIIDLHGFDFMPSLVAQVFNNDANNPGVTLQQVLRFGGSPVPESAGPRLKRLVIESPEGIKRRKLARATGYRKGDHFPDGADLDVEVDVADELRRRGHPDARVEVRLLEDGAEKAELQVLVQPGPAVEVEFEGEKIPRSKRRAIAGLFRTELLDRESSLEAMHHDTVQVLRSSGFLEPEVEARVVQEPAAPTDVTGVLVTSEGGRRASLELLLFEGLPPEELPRVVSLYGSTLTRVELALGLPKADRFLLDFLNTLGYPEAAIDSREISEDGTTLTVRLRPGPRGRVSSVEVRGVEGDEAERLARVGGVAVGDPADLERLSQAARMMENDLERAGYVEARVRARTQLGSTRPLDVAVRFQVEAGSRFQLTGVKFEGLVGSKPWWVQRVAGLELDQPLSSTDVGEARRRLYRTGVFRKIRVETRSDEAAGSPEPTEVTFEVEESSRYGFAYGGRYESGRGLSVVADVVDNNSLGRGHTSGARLLYGTDDRQLRLYHMIPRLVGPKSTLEFFLDFKRELISNFVAKGVEAWVQLTFPLSRSIQTRVYTVFGTRNLREYDPDPDLPLDDRVLLPRVGWQFALSTMDQAFGAQQRKGLFFGIDLSYADQNWGSDLTSVGAFTQVKLFTPFSRKRFNWAQSYRAGLLTAGDQPIPVVDRLRAGGEYSVRGYPRESLGPLTPEGNAIGGEVMFVINQELHFPVYKGLSGLVFFDAGNVWLDFDSVEADLFTSAGVGLRYFSPVGPLRLDYARALDRRPSDPTYKVYLGFGFTF